MTHTTNAADIHRFWGRSVSSDAGWLSDRHRWPMTDIPTLGLPHEMPAIRNSDDLCLCWRALMGPLGFSRPWLWIAFLEPDNMMTAPLTQIEDIPRTADSRMCVSLLEMCRHVVGRNGAGGSVPMLLTGPGRNPIDDSDRSWARCLTSAADHLSVSMWPVHFANDVELGGIRS
jgi:hypothetical protein